MANKRRRDELSDSDSDEVTPGKQILPVANLPHDFDQEPQDGMQYLFLVRRDARRLPRITRVQNPYEVSETKITQMSTPSSTNVLPCGEWMVAFQAHFYNLRKNLAQATTHGDGDDICSRRRLIPEKKDRDAWWKYLAGHPESAWGQGDQSARKRLCTPTRMGGFGVSAKVVLPGNTTVIHERSRHGSPVACSYDLPRNISLQMSALDSLGSAESPDILADDPLILPEKHMEQLSPPQVTPSHLREIDHRMSMHLLMYFTHWINVHLQNPSDPLAAISMSHAQWIFALLTKVEDQLSADEMNLLRNLARACIGLVERCRGRHTRNDDAVLEGDSRPVLVGKMGSMSDASCWMVIAAIAGHWGQRDLWVDAENTLSGA